MLLFRSEEWIEKWCKRNHLKRGEMLTIQEVRELSKLWYGNRLSVEFHGRSMEQVAEVFQQARVDVKVLVYVIQQIGVEMKNPDLNNLVTGWQFELDEISANYYRIKGNR